MPAALKPRAQRKTFEVEVYDENLSRSETRPRRVLAYTPEHARRMCESPTVTVLSVREVSEAERVSAIVAHYQAAGMDTSKGPPWDRDERNL